MRKNWNQIDDEYLRNHYPDERTVDVAAALGRSYASVIKRAGFLGVKKSEQFMSSELSGRCNLKLGESTRFQKGHTNWAKGTKGLVRGGKQTQFKKGAKPHNTKSIGDEAISTDVSTGRKYIVVKVSDQRWVAKQRIVWEQSHKPIPPGMIIRFKDGNTLNCDIDNLEIISKADNMRANSIRRYPVELQKVIKLTKHLQKLTNEPKD